MSTFHFERSPSETNPMIHEQQSSWASSLDLSVDKLDELDLNDFQRLTVNFLLHRKGSDEFDAAPIVDKIDQVVSVKVYRAIEQRQHKDQLADLSEFCERISSDLFAGYLSSFNRDYFQKWRAFVDLLGVGIRLRAERAQFAVVQNNSHSVPASWLWVADQVNDGGTFGIEWSELYRRFNTGGATSVSNITSKAGVSALVSEMKRAGFINVIAEGRRKRLSLGVNFKPHQSSSTATEVTVSSQARDGGGVVKAIRSATCFNQGMFIEYFTISSDLHRAFKSAKRNSQESSFCKLTSYLEAKTRFAARSNFKFLESYFESSHRSTIQPRISLQLLNIPGDEKPIVVDWARNHLRSGSDMLNRVEANTAFQSVVNSGKWYLAQNLENEVFSQRYSNPRLIKERIDLFARSTAIGDLSPNQWRSLWKGAEEQRNFRSAYMSTLVVPLTLMNSPVTEHFRKFMATNLAAGNNQPIDRVIMGFLSFDHVDKDYFDSGTDIDMGYIFADWLSLYVFTRHIYTTLSKTYRDFLAGINVQKSVDHIEYLIAEFSKEMRVLGNVEFGTSANNQLLGIDKLQMKFSESAVY